MFHVYGTNHFIDSWDYILFAKNIISQGIFVPDISILPSNIHMTPPGYPLLIAFFFNIFGETFWPIIFFNALLSASMPILIYYLGKICFNKKVGLWAAFWAIFYINHFFTLHYILREVVNSFMFLVLIIFFIKALEEIKISVNTYILPIIFFILIHIDERFFTYFPILVLLFLLFDNTGYKNTLKKSIIFISCTLFLMLPWLIRNYYVYDRVIILTEMTARFTDPILGYGDKDNLREDELFKLNSDSIHKFTVDVFEYYMNQCNQEHRLNLDLLLKNYKLHIDNDFGQYMSSQEKADFAKTGIDSILVGLKPKPQYFYNTTLYYITGGLKYNLRPYAFTFWERRWVEFKEYFRPFRLYRGYIGDGFRFQVIWSFRHNFFLGITYGILLPFLFIGIFYVVKNNNKYGLILLILILVHMIIHVFLYHARNRYRIPTDAFIVIISFYGIYNLIDHLTNKLYNGE